ncbi:poly(ethylene terephthalate) hydrolase family protein [Paenibacillus montaniterrae]|uniref:poly(ethylene terephthalate) hydrolase family protein n=1 Tax=Paenibacillus montaniterrae TaxID=429341 RepID=UPI001FEA948E|nr:alpha/beta hydrolase [Paenibacillus montaniterrae]
MKLQLRAKGLSSIFFDSKDYSIIEVMYMPVLKKRKWILSLSAVVLIVAAAVSIFIQIILHSNVPEPAEGSIEQRYAEQGSYQVKVEEVKNTLDAALFRIYYPAFQKGESYPVISWGNGTDATPDRYDELLTHLASWGFIVIDSYSKTTGTGKEIVEAIEYLINENERASSLFYQKINTENIGVAGHSQGSTGVINAHTNYTKGSLIKTVVSIALPDLKYCDPEDVYDTARITVPFLIMGGTRDFLISPLSANQLAFYTTKTGTPVMMGMAKGAAHTAIEGNGGNHRGYLTAWMRYQLLDDQEAMKAFYGSSPEMMDNSNWVDVIQANMNVQ